jgi:Protein of unknown function (DUF4199)
LPGLTFFENITNPLIFELLKTHSPNLTAMSSLDAPLHSTPSGPVSYWPTAQRYGAMLAGYNILAVLVGYLTDTDPSFPTTGTAIKTIYYVLGLGVPIACTLLAIKHYRDEEMGGRLTLGQGVMMGIWVGLISAAISAVFMLIYFYVINTGYFDTLKEITATQMAERGMSEEQIEMSQGMMGWFLNPWFIAISQLIFSPIFGSIFGLIGGAILKRDR